MIEKLPVTATPDEASQAVIQLLGEWLTHRTGDRSVILSIADGALGEDNVAGWLAGSGMMQPAQLLTMIFQLPPPVKALMAIQMRDKSLMQEIDGFHETAKREQKTLEEFKESLEQTGDCFEGLDAIEFGEED